jgi:hypothetical protein
LCAKSPGQPEAKSSPVFSFSWMKSADQEIYVNASGVDKPV